MKIARILAALLAAASRLDAQPAPLAQDYTVVLHNPDSEYYVEGPGLARLGDGEFVAVVPVVPREKWSAERRVEHSRIHLLRSSDGGKSWQQTSELPYYSAAPWVDRGTLYLFANKAGAKTRNDDVLLLRSKDGGKTWSEPVTLFTGHYWNCDTSMVRRDGRIYWAVDDLSLGMNRGPRLIAGDLSGDPLDPKAWRISDVAPFPGVPDFVSDPKFAAQPSQYLEPNVVEVNGRIRVFTAAKLKRPSVAGLCGVLDATDDGTTLDLKFKQFSAMPGGQLKFCILRDDVSGLFWATANLSVDSQDSLGVAAAGEKREDFRPSGGDRRFLMLLYSVDCLNWFQAGCIAQAAKLSQSFMYARPVIDGDDLAIVARSSVNAPNQHDADFATFHRVRDFRRLALKLTPQE